MNIRKILPIGFFALIALFVFVSCSPRPPEPTATPHPPTPQVSDKEQVLALFLQTEGQYLTSAAYLELAGVDLAPIALSECARPFQVWVYDEKGELIGQQGGIAFVYGSHVVVSAKFIPVFPDPDSVPLPPPFPGMSEEDYQKAMEGFKNELRRWQQFTIEPAISWGIAESGGLKMQALEPVAHEDPALEAELQAMGVSILKRLPHDTAGNPVDTPECSVSNVIQTGDPAELKALDFLVHPGYWVTSDGTALFQAPVEGSYMVALSEKGVFYFQGSVMTTDFVSLVFAFDKEAQRFVAVGAITASGERVESRGLATDIVQFFDLMRRAGVQISTSPSQTPVSP